MAKKYLDLDAIESVIGEITLNGQTYPVSNPTVKQLINIAALESSEEDDESNLNNLVELIHEMCGISTDELNSMPLDKLHKLLEFITTISDTGDNEKNGEAPQGANPETETTLTTK